MLKVEYLASGQGIIDPLLQPGVHPLKTSKFNVLENMLKVEFSAWSHS